MPQDTMFQWPFSWGSWSSNCRLDFLPSLCSKPKHLLHTQQYFEIVISIVP